MQVLKLVKVMVNISILTKSLLSKKKFFEAHNVIDQRVGFESNYGKFKTVNPFQLLSYASFNMNPMMRTFVIPQTNVVSSSTDDSEIYTQNAK